MSQPDHVKLISFLKWKGNILKNISWLMTHLCCFVFSLISFLIALDYLGRKLWTEFPVYKNIQFVSTLWNQRAFKLKTQGVPFQQRTESPVWQVSLCLKAQFWWRSTGEWRGSCRHCHLEGQHPFSCACALREAGLLSRGPEPIGKSLCFCRSSVRTTALSTSTFNFKASLLPNTE